MKIKGKLSIFLKCHNKTWGQYADSDITTTATNNITTTTTNNNNNSNAFFPLEVEIWDDPLGAFLVMLIFFITGSPEISQISQLK